MKSPYTGLPSRSYWRTGVVDRHALSMGDIYVKKFSIRPDEKIATAGSCFAQHIARRLRKSGFDVLDVEPAPHRLTSEVAAKYGFGLYSARYGNVYTVRQMLQIAQESLGLRTPVDAVWEKEGRFFDALRPSVEPGGLASLEAVRRHREQHLARVNLLLRSTSLFIFTMGLTETWESVADVTVYPTAPGTLAGSYDPQRYRFKNLDYAENLADFLQLRELLRQLNPQMRFLITVSPVPLTATAGTEHIVAATTYSKSVLRAVAGNLAQTLDDVDYFPSYEIIAGLQARSQFYENNLRSVAPAGVDVVMRSFFEQHPSRDEQPEQVMASTDRQETSTDEQKAFCEELLLERFAK